MIHSNSVS